MAFLDTPGIHQAKGALNRAMVEAALAALEDVDVVLFLVEAALGPDGKTRPGHAGRPCHSRAARAAEEADAPGDQQDRHRPEAAAPAVHRRRSRQLRPFAEVLPSPRSAGTGVEELLAADARPAPGGGAAVRPGRPSPTSRKRARRRAHPRAGAAPLPAGDPVFRGGGRSRSSTRASGAAPGQQARRAPGPGADRRHDLRRARKPEGHRHRQARRDAEDDRHRRAQGPRAPPGHARVPGPPGEGGAALDREPSAGSGRWGSGEAARRHRRPPQRGQVHALQPHRRPAHRHRRGRPGRHARSPLRRRRVAGAAPRRWSTPAASCPSEEAGLAAQVRAQAELAVAEADVVLMVVDGRTGPTAADEALAGALRRTRQAAAPGGEQDRLAGVGARPGPGDFYRLGIREVFPVSAEHALGMDAVLDAVVARLPAPPETSEDRDSGGEARRSA